MFTKSTLSALRALVYLSGQDRNVPLPHRRIAEAIGESPSYLAKILRQLVRTGILRAEKGVNGGVRMNQSPSEITLLAILESCQGIVRGDYCDLSCEETPVCGFHNATLELHEAVCSTLSNWTLAHVLQGKPRRPAVIAGCLMAGRMQ